MKQKSKESFKHYVKKKAMQYEFRSLMQSKVKLSKLSDIYYDKLQMQDYLNLHNLTVKQAQCVFNFRVRMASFSENFRNGADLVMCPLCGVHRDTQYLGFNNCHKLAKLINIQGTYTDIFNGKINSELAKSLVR